MKKMYFGAWHNFYHLSWPVRFFVEGMIFLFLIFVLFRLLRRLIQKYRKVFPLYSCFIKLCAGISSEVVYILGRNRSWAVETDNKIIEWKYKKLEENAETTAGKKHTRLKCCAAIVILVIYIAAVFVDLPLSKYVQEEYLAEFAGIKIFFRQYEEAISRGYESYPPLIIERKPEEIKEEEAAEAIEKTEQPIYVQLNERGKNGANVRRAPSLAGEVVGGVNGESEILYQHQWDCDDEERYWIKIYIPADGVEGWLSGKLVDSVQLEEFINESETW